MKDQKDTTTAEIIQLAPKAPELSLPKIERPQPKRTSEQIANAANNRARLGMESWLPVSFIAEAYCMSTRRVRTLLASGRLAGRQLENGYWEVKFPLTLTHGKRAADYLWCGDQKAGTDEGTQEMKTLTGERKIMNIAKPGTVSLCGALFKNPYLINVINTLRLYSYTLCEVE